MAKAIGIDLGTTNSVVSYVEGGQPIVLENAEGSRLTPSVVALNPKTSERYVGLAAKRQGIVNPENTIFSVKRLMGYKHTDKVIQDDIKKLPYRIEPASNKDAHVRMGNDLHSPAEISSMVLQKMKVDAEAKLGGPVTEAVITVPAYFNDAQRQATKDAGAIAGLEVLRIINEPTAAALAYGLDQQKEATLAVFDLGGGTFDITILRLGEGVFEVMSTSGDTHLGGDDFDQRIMEWLSEEFRKETTIDLSGDRMALQRLKEAAEKAKVELSSVTQTEVNLPFISADSAGPKHLVQTFSRSQLERLCDDLLSQIDGPCKLALEDAKVSPNDIDEVILVGGMTRMPVVKEKVKSIFGKEPNHSVNPDEAVAIGAGLQAAVLKGEVQDILLLDVTPLTLGVETLGGVTDHLIERNTTIPTSKSKVYTTAEDNQTSVEIHVLQGERPMAPDNKSAGRFILDGILPAARGVPKVEVTFDIDANGILSVSAKDQATGREQKIVIQSSSGLSQAEIDQLIQDAAEHANDDQLRQEAAQLHNSADQLVHTAEKLIEDNPDKLEPEVQSDIKLKIDAVRQARSTGEKMSIEAAMTELNSSLQNASAQIYQGSSDAGSEDPAQDGPPGDSTDTAEPKDTVEGEFREL